MEKKRGALQLLLTLCLVSVAVCSISNEFLLSIALRSTCDPTLSCNPEGVPLDPGTRVPDPKDCHKFYICVLVGGEVVASDSSVSCPEGEFFNAATEVCEPEMEPCTILCEGSCSLSCKMEFQAVGNPSDCSKYYVCVLGNDRVEADCPVETPYFDGDTCTDNEASCCDFCTPICYESNVQIPDPYDCHKYYICLEEGPPDESTHFTCSSGTTVFDPFLGGCVEGTTCEPLCSDSTPLPTSTTSAGTTKTSTSTGTTKTSTSTVTTETTTSTGTTETTTSTGTTETTTSTGTTTTTDPGSGQTTTVGNDCPSTYTCRQDGNFPRCPYCDPTYFSCEGGVAQIETCSGGTVFNTNPSFPVCVAANNCPYP